MEFKFSVIIATRDRCDSLKETLTSLLKQDCDWGPVAEILVIDNNSTDGTETLVRSYLNLFRTKLQCLKETRPGKSYCLNLGIDSSTGNVLVFTDDDVVLDPKWLGEIIRFFNEHDVDILGGRTLPLYLSNPPGWIKKNQYNLRGPIVSYDYGEDIIDYNSGKIPAFIGANVVYQKKVFDKVGLYNTQLGPGAGTFGDDIDMFNRAIQLTQKAYYNGRALAWHKTENKRMTLGYLAKWNFEHGKSTAYLEPSNHTQTLIAGIPRYLYRSIMARFFALMVQPQAFIQNWCACFYQLGMMAGHAQYRHQKTGAS